MNEPINVADGEVFYHYTDRRGAQAIQSSVPASILPHNGKIFLTREKLSPEDVDRILFLGRGNGRGTYVVEVTFVSGGGLLYSGKNSNEYIFRGAIRDPRVAKLKVGKNGF